jgi:hypothetical protein
MWSLRTWAAASNEQAVANARTASTECNRRRVEREEVTLFLAGLAGDDRHTTGAEVEHPA